MSGCKRHVREMALLGWLSLALIGVVFLGLAGCTGMNGGAGKSQVSQGDRADGSKVVVEPVYQLQASFQSDTARYEVKREQASGLLYEFVDGKRSGAPLVPESRSDRPAFVLPELSDAPQDLEELKQRTTFFTSEPAADMLWLSTKIQSRAYVMVLERQGYRPLYTFTTPEFMEIVYEGINEAGTKERQRVVITEQHLLVGPMALDAEAPNVAKLIATLFETKKIEVK